MSLYSHWNFNENDATKVYDYSDNERHSSSVNALSIIAGEIGYACDFNGSSAYANFGNIADLGGTDDITIHCKFKKDTSTKGFIIFKDNHFKISTDLADTITFSLKIGEAWVNLTSVSTFTNGTWYKVICKYDGVDIKIFVNGIQDATAAQTGNLTASSSNCYLGYDGTTNYYDGKVEVISIYNTGLTTDNITALNNNPSGILFTTRNAHSFLTGDLIGARLNEAGESKGVITYKVDVNNFYYLPIANKPIIGEKLVQVGNVFNTARQTIFNLNTEGGPEIYISDLVSSHTKRKSSALKQIAITKTGIKSGIGQQFTKKISFSSAQILALNTTPQILVAAPGSGKAVVLLRWQYLLTFATTAYATNTKLIIITDTANTHQGRSVNALIATATRFAEGGYQVDPSQATGANQYVANKALQITVETGDPTAGDSAMDIYVYYSIIDV